MPQHTVQNTQIQGISASSKTYPKNQNGWGCSKTGVRQRSKLWCQRKSRRKSGLRSAQRTYHGTAVTQNEAITKGCRNRNGTSHWRDRAAHNNVAPPARITPAGPFASTA